MPHLSLPVWPLPSCTLLLLMCLPSQSHYGRCTNMSRCKLDVGKKSNFAARATHTNVPLVSMHRWYQSPQADSCTHEITWYPARKVTCCCRGDGGGPPTIGSLAAKLLLFARQNLRKLAACTGGAQPLDLGLLVACPWLRGPCPSVKAFWEPQLAVRRIVLEPSAMRSQCKEAEWTCKGVSQPVKA